MPRSPPPTNVGNITANEGIVFVYPCENGWLSTPGFYSG